MKKRSPWPALLVAACSLGFTLPLAAVNTVSNTTTHATFPTITAALAALDADGQTLAIASGVYTEPELVVSWAVTLRGDDAASAIIQPTDVLGSAATRVARVWIPAELGVTLPVVFERLTLRHGNTENSGGALLVEEGSVMVRACVVSQNAAAGAGGGVFCMPGGDASLTLEDTTICANTAGGQGGGAIRAVCSQCSFEGNAASHGGAAAYSVLSDCTIANNTATQQGGGLYGGSAIRCEVVGNTSLYGGGAAGTALANALVVSNTAAQSGGGIYLGSLTNCTVVGNNAATAGGGVCGGTAVNTLFDDNTAPLDGDYDSGALLAHSRAEPLAPGIGNVIAPPLFRDVAAGDYRLLPNSLCIDAGLSAAAPAGSDFSGQARIQGAAVDLGAFEQTPADTVGTPVFTPEAGALFTDPLAVMITCPTEGAVIRYTLDGTVPTLSSALYSEPITLTQTTTVKAMALKDEMVNSTVVSAVYTWRARVETPVIVPASGTIFSEPLTVSITCATAGAAVRYTLDNTAPTPASALYSGPISLTQTTTVKATAFKDGMAESALAAATYTWIERVATPVFAPADAAVFTNALDVTITCATAGATIRYTLDGTAPIAASALYTGIVTLAQSATVAARAFKGGLADSFVVTAGYTRLAKVGVPVFSPASGVVFTNALEVTITCPTNGAAIHYTLDGSDPTAASAAYTVPLALTQSLTVKARAFKAGMVDSEIAVASYTRVVPLEEAVGASSLTFTTGGDTPWFVQADEVHSGDHAVQSGVISHYQRSWTEITVSGAGTLGFWWKVSCEDAPRDDWDYVMVTVDGVERLRIDGETGWTESELALGAGTHTVRWTYVKDRIVSAGSDCAWLDTVVWTPAAAETQTSPVPVPYAWLNAFGLPVGGDYEAAAMADVDGDGHRAWQEYVAGSCPTNRLSVFQVDFHWVAGAPRLTWQPDLAPARHYTVWGKARLDAAEWQTPTNAASRFFRVEVSLP